MYISTLHFLVYSSARWWWLTSRITLYYLNCLSFCCQRAFFAFTPEISQKVRCSTLLEDLGTKITSQHNNLLKKHNNLKNKNKEIILENPTIIIIILKYIHYWQYINISSLSVSGYDWQQQGDISPRFKIWLEMTYWCTTRSSSVALCFLSVTHPYLEV